MISVAATTVTYNGDFQTKIKAISEAGFDETEIWMGDLFEHPEGPDIAINIMTDFGVKPIALQALRNFEGCLPEQKVLKRRFAIAYLDMCAALGIPILVLASNTGAEALTENQILIDDLGELGDLAQERGVKIAYEPIAWARYVNSLERAIPLLVKLKHHSVGLQLDSFHVSMERDGLSQLSQYGHTIPIFLVEISDYLRSEKLAPIDISRAYRLFPGEGNSAVEEFGAVVKALGYQGSVVIEIFNAYYKNLNPSVVSSRAFSAISNYRNNFLV